MTSTFDQVQTIVKALKRKPELYFGVAQHLAQAKIVGPWKVESTKINNTTGKTMPRSYVRHAPKQTSLTRIFTPTPQSPTYTWNIYVGDSPVKQGDAATLEQAQNKVDAILINSEWWLT